MTWSLQKTGWSAAMAAGFGMLVLVHAPASAAPVEQQAVSSTRPAETPALTATEQAAVAEMLNEINATSGNALLNEVQRLAKQYSDQQLNLPAIAGVVKAAAGNKLGAFNNALERACRDAPQGSAEFVTVCAAARAVAQTDPEGFLDTAQVQTAATGGGGGGGTGSGLGALGTTTGDGVGNGTTGTTSSSGTVQTSTSFSASTRRSLSSTSSTTTTNQVTTTAGTSPF